MQPKQREEWDSMLLAPLPTVTKKKKPAAISQSSPDGGSGFMDLYKQQKGGA